MKKIGRRLFAILAILGFMIAIPVWILIWVITGFDPISWVQKLITPNIQSKIDEINANTEKVKAETAKLIKENEELEKKIKAKLDRLAREN